MDIHQISGSDNIVANVLSRVEVITAPVKHDLLAVAQDNCDELWTLLVSNTTLQLAKLPISGTSVELYSVTLLLVNHAHTSCLLSTVRYSIPYTLSHPGIKAMAKLVSQHFV